MGNGITKNPCFSGDPYATAVPSDPLPEDSHGHSFMYVPTSAAFATSASSETSFFSLSGAAISANQVTAASMPSFSLLNQMTWPQSSACTFESSRSFASVPLQAVPNRMAMSGPLQSMSSRFSETSGTASMISKSGTLDRSFSSSSSFVRPQASISHLIAERRLARSQSHNERSLVEFLARAASKLRFRGSSRLGLLSEGPADAAKTESSSDGDPSSPPKNNVQWAQGMAGEDRFHVAVSEEHGWVFVGIYDGFNGPDATDYLFANLYVAVHRELKGVLWDDNEGGEPVANADHPDGGNDSPEFYRKPTKRGRTEQLEMVDGATTGGGTTKTIQREVLKALARALRKTEEAFFEAAEQNAEESPELGLMGSCVLVMVMKDKDVYVMNVGDSRVVLARRREADIRNIIGKARQELDGLQTVQLTAEHSTAVEEEVMRIRGQHLNDRNAIINGRVKGQLNVTRAFGAGYLKQPKWNNRLLAAFKVNYIGMDPYLNCIPSLCHHRIGPEDKFLVLSSDGLYQYFTNKEVVDQVQMFTAANPEGDPAQHLVRELLLRAARKAGMECHQLLEVPHGDRRNYHDDVSIIVISFEGRLWRSTF
ncbi:probable protein phosphatase 2C 31 [Lolium perenne]|uniref:probable protein phosphatase 2C 31 n=1 Tax=Lolium perenne TaxID=4522 RepID=UPI0021F53F31|nr:probable protein phosphatase 2C 31 [Lolium perenne]